MKTLNYYIFEKLIINKDTKVKMYNYHPKDKNELSSLIKELLKERGKNADLNDIDTSKITDMSHLFEKLNPHKIDISEWNVSNVRDMRFMFYYCKNFNSDLSEWDISKVKNMTFMFDGCKKFDFDLSKWNVNNSVEKEYMFDNCDSLKNKPSWYNE